MGRNVTYQETTEWHRNNKSQSEISGNKILIKSREFMVNTKMKNLPEKILNYVPLHEMYWMTISNYSLRQERRTL